MHHVEANVKVLKTRDDLTLKILGGVVALAALLGNKQPKEEPSSSLIEEMKKRGIKRNRNYGK